jgi:hypothetical protein
VNFLSGVRGVYGQYNRDIDRVTKCIEYNISSISIPTWWNFDQNNLLATLKKANINSEFS